MEKRKESLITKIYPGDKNPCYMKGYGIKIACYV